MFLATKRYEDALKYFNKSLRPQVWVLTRIAASYAQLGRMAEATKPPLRS